MTENRKKKRKRKEKCMFYLFSTTLWLNGHVHGGPLLHSIAVMEMICLLDAQVD